MFPSLPSFALSQTCVALNPVQSSNLAHIPFQRVEEGGKSLGLLYTGTELDKSVSSISSSFSAGSRNRAHEFHSS